ncbi:MAG: TolC family protein [Muribaculaceae bacterium]
MMMKKTMLTVVAVLLMGSCATAANIQDVLTQVKQNNKQLKALVAQIGADSLDLRSSNNLSNPEVEGAYLFGKGPLGDKWEVGVSQGFDWPGVYSARGKANNHRLEALSWSYRSAQLTVLSEAYDICLEIIACNRSIAFEKRVLSNLTEMYEKSSKGLEQGEVSILDTNKLRIECLAARQRIDESEVLRDAAIKRLEGCNGNVPIGGIESLCEYPQQQLKELSYYLNQVRGVDPQLQELSASMMADKGDVDVAKMQGLPKFKLGYKYANELGDKFNGVTMGVSLPVFENRGKKNAAKARQIATELQYDNVAAAAESLVSENYGKASRLRSQISEYSKALGDGNNLVVLQKALQGGQITLLNYLQEVRYFTEAQAVLLDMEKELNATMLVLNRYQLLQY